MDWLGVSVHDAPWYVLFVVFVISTQRGVSPSLFFFFQTTRRAAALLIHFLISTTRNVSPSPFFLFSDDKEGSCPPCSFSRFHTTRRVSPSSFFFSFQTARRAAALLVRFLVSTQRGGFSPFSFQTARRATLVHSLFRRRPATAIRRWHRWPAGHHSGGTQQHPDCVGGRWDDELTSSPSPNKVSTFLLLCCCVSDNEEGLLLLVFSCFGSKQRGGGNPLPFF